MRRRRAWIRRIGRAAGTLAIGLLLGFLVPTIMADLDPKPEVAAQVAESAVARQFIDAFVADDKATLEGMGIPAEIRSKATRFKAEYALVDAPVHLGSYIAGGYTLHAYSAHVVGGTGEEDLLAWRVATAAGEVVLIDPPGTVATP